MKMKWIYASLCVLSVVLPSYFAGVFFLENGLNMPLFVGQLFAPAASINGADVVVTTVVLWGFIYHETRRQPVKHWWLCIIANVTVGVALGFSLFLLLREIAMDKQQTALADTSSRS